MEEKINLEGKQKLMTAENLSLNIFQEKSKVRRK